MERDRFIDNFKKIHNLIIYRILVDCEIFAKIRKTIKEPKIMHSDGY